MDLLNKKIAIVGLGYVGLPLLVAMNQKFDVIGYDNNKERISELENRYDRTNEISQTDLNHIEFTHDLDTIKECEVYIITVPTPINQAKEPDLSMVKDATLAVSSVVNKGNVIIYESTVFPGVTEEVCAKILEEKSGLKLNQDFYLGYSPERINPGDKSRTITQIPKIVSGSNEVVARAICELYQSFIEAEIFTANSIKIAEAAKVIENIQRDVNIALINEFTQLFDRLNLDVYDVLDAAATKWNFLKFQPGFVGGHCIGVDPYYLTHKAKTVDFVPEMILSGRRINESMSAFAVQKAVKRFSKDHARLPVEILVCGVTFKENCPDTRNSKIFDVIDEFEAYGCSVSTYDPYVTQKAIGKLGNYKLVEQPIYGNYDIVVLAVSHDSFFELGASHFRSLCTADGILYDTKNMFDKLETDLRL